MKIKPNLFIVGAPKSGTATLHNLLGAQPGIFFPKIKELNYFSYPEIESTYYKSFVTGSIKKYLKYYQGKNQFKYWGDGSVSYFINEKVPKRIYDFNKSSKIIICIRNPINRAFSHYLMDKRMGYANQAFIEYIKSPNKYPEHYDQYINNSLYSTHIARYRKLFKSNVFVLELEKFNDKISELFEFLEINEINVSSTFSKINQRKTSRFKIARMFQKNRNLTSKLKQLVPSVIVNTLNPILYKKADNVKITQDELVILKNLFAVEENYYPIRDI